MDPRQRERNPPHVSQGGLFARDGTAWLACYIRFRFMKSRLVPTVVQVIVGGAVVFGIGMWLGRLGAGG
jgi:hypothetical protein